MNLCSRKKRRARTAALLLAITLPLASIAWTYGGIGFGGSTSVPWSTYAWSGETHADTGASQVRVNVCPWIVPAPPASPYYDCQLQTASALTVRKSGSTSTTHAYSYHQVLVSGNWSQTEETYDAQ